MHFILFFFSDKCWVSAMFVISAGNWFRAVLLVVCFCCCIDHFAMVTLNLTLSTLFATSILYQQSQGNFAALDWARSKAPWNKSPVFYRLSLACTVTSRAMWYHLHNIISLMSSTWYDTSDVIYNVRPFFSDLHGTTFLVSSTWYDPSHVIYTVRPF